MSYYSDYIPGFVHDLITRKLIPISDWLQLQAFNQAIVIQRVQRTMNLHLKFHELSEMRSAVIAEAAVRP